MGEASVRDVPARFSPIFLRDSAETDGDGKGENAREPLLQKCTVRLNLLFSTNHPEKAANGPGSQMAGFRLSAP